MPARLLGLFLHEHPREVEVTPSPSTPDAPGDSAALASRRGRLARPREWAVSANERGRAVADSLAVRLEMTKMHVLPRSLLADRMQPDIDRSDDWSFLVRPAVIGFVALVAVAVGASLPSSPFKLEQPGAWFFGVPSEPGAPPTTYLLFGLVAVYGGLVLLMRTWCGLIKALGRRPAVPIKYLWIILALWMIPMLAIAPIFSRDVFSYAAQGEMMSHHINPYDYGPGTLGAGPYVAPVDNLWMNTPAPYGPLFLMVDGFFASASLHHELVTVIFLRVLALVGVALIAWCMPKLARSCGVDAGPVFVLTALNPLVVLTLVGAGHNDAIMIGLLVAGLTAARYKHPVWGVVLCALAAAIKVPAAVGIIYIGWDWLGTGLPLRQRIRPLVTAGIISTAVLTLLSTVSGLGWGWVANLATPGTVRSWLAPATGVGMAVAGLAHTVGLEVSSAGVLSVTRVLGLVGGRRGGGVAPQTKRPHRQPEGHRSDHAPVRRPGAGGPAVVPDVGDHPAGAGGHRSAPGRHHRHLGHRPVHRAPGWPHPPR